MGASAADVPLVAEQMNTSQGMQYEACRKRHASLRHTSSAGDDGEADLDVHHFDGMESHIDDL